MRKLLPVYYHANDQMEDSHPGCMWGIFHVLDYHHWHDNVKKMLPHRRHNKRKHAKRNKSPKAILGVQDAGEVPKLLDAEASHFLVNQRTTEANSTHKKSLKARIKALVAEEISREVDCKKRGSKFPARSGLGRTLSIHHLESSDHDFNKANTEWRNPIIFLPKKTNPGATKLQHPARLTATEWKRFDMCTAENLMDFLGHHKPSQNDSFSQEKCNEARGSSFNQALKKANQLVQNGSHRQLKEYVDVLELYQVNRELFQEFQHNTDVGKATCFEMPQASNTKARLTKSGSFPVADLYSRNFKPSKLKHKQTEIWSFPRGEKFHCGTQERELVAPKYSEDPCTKSGPVIADGSGSRSLNKEANWSLGISEGSVDQGCSKVVTPLKDIRQRIEVVFEEDENESNCTFLDETSTSGKEMTGMWETSTMDDNSRDRLSSCLDHTSGSVHDLSKGTPRHRRTSSLNESLHRYAHLFEYSFSMKTNWNKSKSLKLTNEYEISSGGSAPISFKRNRSLPHVDSYWPLQNEECHDTFYPDMSSRTALAGRIHTEDNIQSESKPVGLPVTENEMKLLPLDSKEESEHVDNMVERSDCSPEVEYLGSLTMGINECDTAKMDGQCEGIDEPTVEQSNSYKDQKITFTKIDGNKDPEQPGPSVTILGSCFQEEVTSLSEFSTSKGVEYNYNYSDERDSRLNLLDSLDTGILSQSCSTTYPENPNKSVKNHNRVEFHTGDSADLNYVREVLERAGFNENGFHAAWYSSDQPLSPLLLDEVSECWWPHEAECIGRHQLLFDLVNEVILEIYERSFTYYPKELSSSCRVRPMHGRFHDEEVLKSIRLDQTVDDPVTQDYAKEDDGWMNLQMESECVALELEDLIFDQLLEEMVDEAGLKAISSSAAALVSGG